MSYVYHFLSLSCLVFVCLGFVVSSFCLSRVCDSIIIHFKEFEYFDLGIFVLQIHSLKRVSIISFCQLVWFRIFMKSDLLGHVGQLLTFAYSECDILLIFSFSTSFYVCFSVYKKSSRFDPLFDQLNI